MPGIAGGSSTGEGDAAKSRRSRLRRVPQNGTALLVKVPAPSGPAAFPLRDARVARFCRRTSRRSEPDRGYPQAVSLAQRPGLLACMITVAEDG